MHRQKILRQERSSTQWHSLQYSTISLLIYWSAHFFLISSSCSRVFLEIPHDHLLLDSVLNIGPLISSWELDKFKNCWNKSFRTSKILTLLYQQLSNSLISQRDMSGPRLGALSNNRWSGVLLVELPCTLISSTELLYDLDFGCEDCEMRLSAQSTFILNVRFPRQLWSSLAI